MIFTVRTTIDQNKEQKKQISSCEHTNKKIQSDGVNVFRFSQHRLFHTWDFHHILPDFKAISTIQWKHFISFYYFFLYSFFPFFLFED